jgi:hypothetical protein
MMHIRIMKNILRLEELALFLLFSTFFFLLTLEWWWYPVLILAPDIGMLGYLVNSRVGSFTYNIFHHRAIGVALFALSAPSMLLGDPISGWQEWTLAAAFIILAHASLDRLFGYGLKYADAFTHTHLGTLPGKGAIQ